MRWQLKVLYLIEFKDEKVPEKFWIEYLWWYMRMKLYCINIVVKILTWMVTDH